MSGSFFGGFGGGSSGNGGNPFQSSGTTNPFQTSSSSSRPPGTNNAPSSGTFPSKFGTGPFQTPQTTDRNPFQKQTAFAGGATTMNMNNEGKPMNATAPPFVPSSSMKSQSNPFASANPFGSHGLGDHSTTTAKSGAGFGSGGVSSFSGTHGSHGSGVGSYGQFGGAGRGGVSQDARQGQGPGQGFFHHKSNAGNDSGPGQGPSGYPRQTSPPHQYPMPGTGPGQGPGQGQGSGQGQGQGHGGKRGPPGGFTCRVCASMFPSYEEMKAHIKTEKHYYVEDPSADPQHKQQQPHQQQQQQQQPRGKGTQPPSQQPPMQPPPTQSTKSPFLQALSSFAQGSRAKNNATPPPTSTPGQGLAPGPGLGRTQGPGLGKGLGSGSSPRSSGGGKKKGQLLSKGSSDGGAGTGSSSSGGIVSASSSAAAAGGFVGDSDNNAMTSAAAILADKERVLREKLMVQRQRLENITQKRDKNVGQIAEVSGLAPGPGLASGPGLVSAQGPGLALSPGLIRPDGTLRKERPVKPGYVPQDEVPPYDAKAAREARLGLGKRAGPGLAPAPGQWLVQPLQGPGHGPGLGQASGISQRLGLRSSVGPGPGLGTAAGPGPSGVTAGGSGSTFVAADDEEVEEEEDGDEEGDNEEEWQDDEEEDGDGEGFYDEDDDGMYEGEGEGYDDMGGDEEEGEYEDDGDWQGGDDDEEEQEEEEDDDDLIYSATTATAASDVPAVVMQQPPQQQSLSHQKEEEEGDVTHVVPYTAPPSAPAPGLGGTFGQRNQVSSSHSNNNTGFTSNSGSNNYSSFVGSSSSSVGSSSGISCEDMCPMEERQKRIDESDVHRLEYPPGWSPLTHQSSLTAMNTQATMIKKFQRSSADHDLLIPHLLRTPLALYKTICYMEDHIMERHLLIQQQPNQQVHERERDKATPLFIYLFVWDRFRMIAKDFILQISALPKDPLWVKCHERMARWFVMMNHYMTTEEDFGAGHAQQNEEQLNNLFKTLKGYYTNPSLRQAYPHCLRNQGEFLGYFILMQLGNGGEVNIFLQQLLAGDAGGDILSSPDVQFAVQVWLALKTNNFTRYFRLLRQATFLQACLMHRYVGQVRMVGLRQMMRAFKGTGEGNTKAYYPLVDLGPLLMFEDMDDAYAFLTHCGLEIVAVGDEEDTTDQGYAVILSATRDISEMLPEDKNGHPIPPTVSPMIEGIESKRLSLGLSIPDVCRGLASPHYTPFQHTSVPSPMPLPSSSSSSSSSSSTAASSSFPANMKAKDVIVPGTVPLLAPRTASKIGLGGVGALPTTGPFASSILSSSASSSSSTMALSSTAPGSRLASGLAPAPLRMMDGALSSSRHPTTQQSKGSTQHQDKGLNSNIQTNIHTSTHPPSLSSSLVPPSQPLASTLSQPLPLPGKSLLSLPPFAIGGTPLVPPSTLAPPSSSSSVSSSSTSMWGMSSTQLPLVTTTTTATTFATTMATTSASTTASTSGSVGGFVRLTPAVPLPPSSSSSSSSSLLPWTSTPVAGPTIPTVAGPSPSLGASSLSLHVPRDEEDEDDEGEGVFQELEKLDRKTAADAVAAAVAVAEQQFRQPQPQSQAFLQPPQHLTSQQSVLPQSFSAPSLPTSSLSQLQQQQATASTKEGDDQIHAVSFAATDRLFQTSLVRRGLRQWVQALSLARARRAELEKTALLKVHWRKWIRLQRRRELLRQRLVADVGAISLAGLDIGMDIDQIISPGPATDSGLSTTPSSYLVGNGGSGVRSMTKVSVKGFSHMEYTTPRRITNAATTTTSGSSSAGALAGKGSDTVSFVGSGSSRHSGVQSDTLASPGSVAVGYDPVRWANDCLRRGFEATLPAPLPIPLPVSTETKASSHPGVNSSSSSSHVSQSTRKRQWAQEYDYEYEDNNNHHDHGRDHYGDSGTANGSNDSYNAYGDGSSSSGISWPSGTTIHPLSHPPTPSSSARKLTRAQMGARDKAYAIADREAFQAFCAEQERGRVQWIEGILHPYSTATEQETEIGAEKQPQELHQEQQDSGMVEEGKSAGDYANSSSSSVDASSAHVSNGRGHAMVSMLGCVDDEREESLRLEMQLRAAVEGHTHPYNSFITTSINSIINSKTYASISQLPPHSSPPPNSLLLFPIPSSNHGSEPVITALTAEELSQRCREENDHFQRLLRMANM